MNTEAKSVCKMCHMEISSLAKKCPYCQHFQSKWSMVAFHPAFVIIPMVIAYAFMGTMFQTTFSEGEPFYLYADAVSVIETKMVFGVSGFGVSGCEHKSHTVALLGKIQNDSQVPWEDIKLEATFFDKDGTLIDATQEEKYSFMVAPNDKSTFKLSFRREFPEESYDSFKVRIISAKDERKGF